MLLGGIAGWETVAVPDAVAALDIVKQQQIDVLLLDLNLPGCSGLELLRLLRATPNWHDQPVIVISAEAKQPAVQAAVRAGQGLRCIAKPFDLGEVVDAVVAALP
jgi:CheY-like chemotaxis protein